MHMRNIVLAATLGVAAAAPAQAQMLTWQDRGFVNFSAVLQSGPGNNTVNGSFELYEETGTYQGPWHLSGGASLDLSGGMRVWRNLAVGLGYSRLADTSPVTITALIPDRLDFDRPHEETIDVGELDHSQNVVHISAVWFWPVTDKIDVAVSAGPSIFSVKADTVTGIDVLPDTSIPTGVVVSSASESTVGIHFGVDVTYKLTQLSRRIATLPGNPWVGAGLLLRYAGSSVDLPAVNSLDVGGFQAGIGLRVRF